MYPHFVSGGELTVAKLSHTMPRRSRVVMPGVPMHLIQRGNNRGQCFFADADYLQYLEWLSESAQVSGCALHAYVLMTNHVHLLLTPRHEGSVGILMKRLGQRYVQYINRTYQRSGTLWEGRYRSCLIEQETYLLVCQRYIEMNPVRAGIVKHPRDYRWSSYRANGQGEQTDMLYSHPLYLELGRTESQRLEAYRELFRLELDEEETAKVRRAVNGNYVLGSDRFIREISNTLGCRVTPGKAGRPKKE